MIKTLLYFLLATLIIAGCKQQEKEFFNGSITYFELPHKIDTIKGNQIFLDGIHTGYLSVYDSLILLNSAKYPNQYLQIYSLNSGKHLASICDKGQGPKNFPEFISEGQFMVENNEIKLWGDDRYKKHTLINLTKSIKNKTTELDSIIPINWFKERNINWHTILVLNDGRFIIKSQPEDRYINSKDKEGYSYHLYQYTYENKINSFELTKDIFEDINQNIWAIQNFSSSDALHPTRQNKIAMALLGVPQINILDINTGELTGFRMKGFKIKDLFNYKNHVYYKNLTVSEEYIYALFSGLRLEEGSNAYSANNQEIHVFDWEGEIVKRISLEQGVCQIAYNIIDNKLYGINNEDEVFCFSVN